MAKGWIIALLILGSKITVAQFVIPPTPTSGSIFQDFNTLPSVTSVPWTDLVTIPYWYMQRTPTTPGTPPYPITINVDNGNSNVGNGYSYGSTGSTDRALGSLGSNNAASGHYAWGIQFQNMSGYVVSDFKVSYRGEQWRDGGVSSVQMVKFYYKTSPTVITNLQPSISAGWTSVGALNFTCLSNIGTGTGIPLNGNSPTYSSIISSPVSSLSLTNGQFVMMKWDDPKYSGTTDHGMSTDSVTISWTVCSNPTTQTSNINAASSNLTSIDLQWTNGNGAARYIVIDTVNNFPPPVDGTGPGVANPVCSTTFPQVVYAGTGTSVTVSGLVPCRTYYFRAYEYNCSGINIKYNVTTTSNNPATLQTSMANMPNGYDLTGQTEYCTSDPGVAFVLSGSQVGVNYQLLRNGTLVNSQPGTGNALNFTGPLVAGSYTVFAMYGSYTYCSASMNDTLIVNVYPVPVAPTGAVVDRNHICADDAGTITLTAIGGSGTNHEWYANSCQSAVIDTSAVITIPSPTVTTTYYVSWTTVDCGTSTCASVTVTVDDPPTIANAGPPTQGICGSLTTTLAGNQAIIGSGTWSFSPVPPTTGTITFTLGANVYNTGIQASDTGTYHLIWTISNGTVCPPSIDTTTITFSDALQVVASSNSPLCSGDDLNLFSDIGGATYSWTGPNGFTSGLQNPSVLGITLTDSGDYVITVSAIPGGCPNTSDTTHVVVHQSAAAGTASSNPPSVCSAIPGFIILSSIGGAGDTLHWYEGSCTGPEIGTGNNLSVPSPTTTTTYYGMWASNYCGNSSCFSVTVTAVDPPTQALATPVTVCGLTPTTLQGNNPASGTGTWTCTSGPGTYNFSDPNAYNSTFSASALGIYNLVWTISTGPECPASSATTTVEFSNTITVIASSNSPACDGDTIFLFASIPGATYSWRDPSNTVFSTDKDPVIPGISMSDAGTYRVDVTNVPGGCPDTWDDVTVAVVSKPATPAISSANVSGNSQDVCSNTSATYSINPPAGGSSYIWSVSGGGVLTHGSPSNQASINWSTSGGPYQVSVTETSSQGCKGDPVLLNVTVHDPPAITSLDTTGATNGQSNGTVTVNSPGATEYSLDGVTWQASPSFSGLAASPPTYTAYTRNSFGCVQTQTFTINNIIVGLTLNADTAQGCPLTTISISVYATGMNNFRKFNICLTYDASLASFDGIRNTYNSFLPDSSIPGQLQITWESPTDVSIPDGTLLCILDFRGKKSGFSIVTYDKLIAGTCGIFDGTGMSYVIAFKDGGLDFLPQPDANIIGDTQLCEDEAMNLYAIGDATQRTWTLPDGSSDTNQLITRDPVALADSGTYMLLTKNSIGCINRDTVKVIVRELPEPELTGGVSPVCVESVTQGLNPGNFTSYEWSDGSTAPILTISHEGIYWVIVTDEFGCKNIDTTELVKCPTSILVPTAFSPNGDGANDRFRAHYTDTDILENYKLLIYDRWGRLMFETNDIMQSWDGTYDGKICPVGAYTYVISFKKPFGKTLMQKLPYRGIVNLIR